MDRCFKTPAIVRQVVQACLPCVSGEDRMFLAGLAHVSRAFYEPAMDALLARVDGLGPLFFCLPDVTTELIEGIPTLTCVDPPPTSDGWARFASHARRVRELRLLGSSCCFDDVHTERAFLDILRDHHPGQVLPHLRALDVDLEQYTALRAERFLQSSLVAVRAKTARSLEDSVAFVARLARVSDLQRIELAYEHYHGPRSAALADELSTTVRALQGLRALAGGPHCLSIDALAHLSGLPAFDTLSLGATPANISLPSSLLSGKFASLTTLSIEFLPGTAPAEWAALLHAFSPAPLHTLRLTIKDEVLADDTPPAALLPLLGALGAFPTLLIFTLDIDVYLSSSLWREPFLPSTALSALLRTPTLTHLTLLGTPLSLAPPLLARAAAAWPHLQLLRIHPSKTADTPPEACAPLGDLAHLARLPSLMHVDVALAPVPPAWAWADDPALPASRARKVVLVYADVADGAVEAVAGFLDRYFPEAEIEGARDGEDGLEVEVLELGEALQRVQALRTARA